MSSITPLLSRPHVMGFEARAGLESFARTLCGSLGLRPVKVKWADVSTAAISQGGTMYLSDLGDATKVARNILARYAGYIVHELLHRKYTDFKARDPRRYVDRLHNALEDAWIERKAIASGLTGNVEPLLHTLLRGLIDEAKGVDFAALENLPFSLAVYTRRYGITVAVPAALLPVWKDQAACWMGGYWNRKSSTPASLWIKPPVGWAVTGTTRSTQPLRSAIKPPVRWAVTGASMTRLLGAHTGNMQL